MGLRVGSLFLTLLHPKLPGPRRAPGFLPGLPIWSRSLRGSGDGEHPQRSSASPVALVARSLTPRRGSAVRACAHPPGARSPRSLRGGPLAAARLLAHPAPVPGFARLLPEPAPPRPPASGPPSGALCPRLSSFSVPVCRVGVSRARVEVALPSSRPAEEGRGRAARVCVVARGERFLALVRFG